MTHDEYVKMLKDFLLKEAVKSAFIALVKQFAFLGWGPLAPILKLVLEKVFIVFLNETELAIFIKYTDFRVSRQGRAFSEAAMKNYEAQRNGSDEEKKIAEENLKNTFREFVKLTN